MFALMIFHDLIRGFLQDWTGQTDHALYDFSWFLAVCVALASFVLWSLAAVGTAHPAPAPYFSGELLAFFLGGFVDDLTAGVVFASGVL
jgi:hypothetical protein